MNYDTNSGLSASDVALLTGNNGNNNNGFGNDGWWIILLLLALGGWNNNGFGNNGGNFGGPTFIPYGNFGNNNCGIDPWGTTQRQLDQGFSSINDDLNQVNNNVTQGFYNTNTGMLTGFGNTNTNLANGFANTNATLANGFGNTNTNLANGFANTNLATANGFANASLATANGFATTQRQLCESTDAINANINNNGYETRLLGVNMNSALQQCCCDNKAGIADLKYTIATENCADRQAISDGIRDVIQANTANTNAILQKLTQQELDAKNDTIANLRAQVNMQNLAASQATQTSDIINAVRPCPIPSYLTCSPYQSIPVQYVAAGGCNTGCGCNGNNIF